MVLSFGTSMEAEVRLGSPLVCSVWITACQVFDSPSGQNSEPVVYCGAVPASSFLAFDLQTTLMSLQILMLCLPHIPGLGRIKLLSSSGCPLLTNDCKFQCGILIQTVTAQGIRLVLLFPMWIDKENETHDGHPNDNDDVIVKARFPMLNHLYLLIVHSLFVSSHSWQWSQVSRHWKRGAKTPRSKDLFNNLARNPHIRIKIRGGAPEE